MVHDKPGSEECGGMGRIKLDECGCLHWGGGSFQVLSCFMPFLQGSVFLHWGNALQTSCFQASAACLQRIQQFFFLQSRILRNCFSYCKSGLIFFCCYNHYQGAFSPSSQVSKILASCVLWGDIANVFLFFLFTPKRWSWPAALGWHSLISACKEGYGSHTGFIFLHQSPAVTRDRGMCGARGGHHHLPLLRTELLRPATGCSAQGSSDGWSLLVQSAMEMRKSKAKWSKTGARAETCHTLLAWDWPRG